MLQLAFQRGEICWAAPFGHIVWVDNNDVAYDISGCNESECQYYIPICMLGDMVKDFTHVPGDAYNASEQEIASVIVKWEKIIHTKKNSDALENFDVMHSDFDTVVSWYRKCNTNNDAKQNDIVQAKMDYLLLETKNPYSRLHGVIDSI